MKIWTEELAQVEAAALRVEALEREAEKRFDTVRAEALARGEPEQLQQSPELSEGMAGRPAAAAACERGAQVMDASLDGKDSGA